MTLEFTNKQFRRLLDLVYIGNWILNSTRGDQRFADYDEVESLVFGKALVSGMPALAEVYEGEIVPSRASAEGGIHEAIMEYENNVFFDILAEDLARRDMDDVPIDESNFAELTSRIDAYITEFEEHGTDNSGGVAAGGRPGAQPPRGAPKPPRRVSVSAPALSPP